MQPETRRLVQMSIDLGDGTAKTMDMLLAKKQVPARKKWLSTKGDQAQV